MCGLFRLTKGTQEVSMAKHRRTLYLLKNSLSASPEYKLIFSLLQYFALLTGISLFQVLLEGVKCFLSTDGKSALSWCYRHRRRTISSSSGFGRNRHEVTGFVGQRRHSQPERKTQGGEGILKEYSMMAKRRLHYLCCLNCGVHFGSLNPLFHNIHSLVLLLNHKELREAAQLSGDGRVCK